MPNHTLLKAGLTAGVLCSSIAAVPAVAQAPLAATGNCGAGESRVVNYTRNLGG